MCYDMYIPTDNTKENTMNYLEASLSKEETVVEMFKFHWLYKATPAILFLTGAAVIPVNTLAAATIFSVSLHKLISIWSTDQGVTSKRIVLKTGFIARSTTEINVKKIETVTMKQGVFGRVFGYGSMVITGTGNAKMKLKFISKPLKAKIAVDDLMDS